MNALYTKEVKMNRQIVAQPIWIMYVAVAIKQQISNFMLIVTT